MFSFTRSRARKGAALIAVLQAILLISTLVLTPVSAIAQDVDVESTPVADVASEVVKDEAPAPPADRPGPTKEAASKQAADKKAAPAAAEPTAEAGPAVAAAPDVKLRVYPKQLKIATGDTKVLSAWTCPADDRSPFGPDKEPGTSDDECDAARADWSVDDEGLASLSKDRGHKTRVTLTGAEDARVVARIGDDLKQGVKLIYNANPAKAPANAIAAAVDTVADEPVADEPKAQVDEPKDEPVADEPKAQVDEPVADEPVADEPKAQVDEPVADEPVADEPKAQVDEPVADEPVADEPKDEPVADEPKDEPVADEPKDEPVADEPKDEPVADCRPDPLTGSCLPAATDAVDGEAGTDAPVCLPDPLTGGCAADVAGEPQPETAKAPAKNAIRTAANGTLQIRKGGDANGNNVSPLAGARFNIYRDDGDNTFEPNTQDQLVGTSDETNGSGVVNVSLPPGQYWVRESTSPAGWNPILQIATGGNDSNNSASPYAFRYNVPDGRSVETRQFVNRRDNPGFPEVCGLNVALIFDRSASISNGEWADMVDAAEVFVDALTGTPSSIAVYSFSTNASTHGGFNSVLENANAVMTIINGISGPTSGGYTNWDAAFREVAGDGADVILLLTDGNPTTYGDPGDDNVSANVDVLDIERGVAAANLAKASVATPKVIAVGIGTGTAVSSANLQAVSGPVQNEDWFRSNFDDLGDTLNDIAQDLCGGSVTVIKEVPAPGGEWEPAGGWTFTAQSANATASPGSGATAANGPSTGSINFNFDNNSAVSVTITETVQDGWTLVQQGPKNAVCVRNRKQGVDETNTTNGVSFTLGATDIVTCRFRNKPNEATIELKKTWVGTPGDVTLGIGTSQGGSQVGTGTANGANGTTGIETVNPGTFYLSEVGDLAGYSVGDLVCTGAAAAPVEIDDTNWSIAVAATEAVVCTFTNTRDQGSIELKKVWAGKGGQTTLRIGTSQGGSQVDQQQTGANGAAPLTTGANTVNTGTYYLSESGGLGNYSVGDLTCTGAAASPVEIDDTNWTIAVGAKEKVVCTFTNAERKLVIEKSATPEFYSAAGDEITYTVKATNAGQATLTNVDISDELIDDLDSWTCDPDIPVASLAPGASITCTATYTITEADVAAGSVPNTACADSNETPEVCDNETVELSELEIVKSADVQYFTAAGDEIVYTIVATNVGEYTLTNVDISDELIKGIGDWECTPPLVVSELASQESITCTATYTVTAADVEAGSVLNVACADSDQTPEVCDDVTTPLAKLVIEKSASPETYSAAGDEIVYTITATNVGEMTLTDVDISDELIDGLGSWECVQGDTDVDLPVAELIAGQSITCTATYTITEADVTAGSVPNTACATSDETGDVCDDAIVNVIAVEITKTADPVELPEPGGPFTYTLVIHNPSVVPVTITSLTDTNSGLATDFSACEALVGTVLAPDDGASGGPDEATCQYDVVRTNAGVYDNTAAVVVEDEEGTEATDDDDETVEVTDVLPEIVVTKTPSTTFVDAPGGDVEFTFVVTNLSVEPVTITSLVDDVYGDLSGLEADCTVGTVLAAAGDDGDSCEIVATFAVTGDPDTDHVNVFTAAAEDDEGNPTEDEDDAVVLVRGPINIWIEKTPNRDLIFSGQRVTFTYEFRHDMPFTLYLVSLIDDVYGDMLVTSPETNVDIISNDCKDLYGVGFPIEAETTYTCEFTAVLHGTPANAHQNWVVITATDVDPTSPDPENPRFATWTDDAVVNFKGGGGSGGGGGQPPTDMLSPIAAAESGSPLDAAIVWTLWVMLTAVVIISAGWVIRRQRFSEI